MFLVVFACGCALAAGGALAGAPSPRDAVPPQVPRDVHATSTTVAAISIAWDRSHDNKGKWDVGYSLYRGGTLVETTNDTSYTFRSLACGKSYKLEVDAFRGLVSARSAGCKRGPEEA